MIVNDKQRGKIMENKIKTLLKAGVKLTLGFFTFALGSVVIINCIIGVAPWDVLHQGLSLVLSIGVGRAQIYSGTIIIILDVLLGQNIGWATIFNMFGIGMFVDILMFNNLVPAFHELIYPLKLGLIIIGICLQGLGTYLYISTGFGAGPRDGLMVALSKKLNKPFGLVKSVLDVLVVVTGYFLGGNFGIGTLIMAFGAGYIWELMYRKMNFDISSIDHRFIADDILYIKNKIRKVETPE